MGNGRYSALVGYKDWYQFNCTQRAHQNYVEQSASIIILVLLLGLYAPVQAAQASLVYIVGRQLYSSGYRSSGPAGRFIGAVILDLALVFVFGAAMYYGAAQAGVVQKVMALVK
jgi:glutathione S-transferase